MFDKKKRHSFTLAHAADSLQTEEFRRVAVRRRASAGVVNVNGGHHASATGTPSPGLLQRPGKSGPQETNGWEIISTPSPKGDKNRDISEINGVSVHIRSASNSPGFPSPVEVKPARSGSVDEALGTLISPAISNGGGTHSLVVPAFVESLSQALNRGIESRRSPVGEGQGGHSKPAKLSPRGHSLLMTRIQTPRSFKRRSRSFSPASPNAISQSIERRGRSSLKTPLSANCSMSTGRIYKDCSPLGPTTNGTAPHLDPSGTTGLSPERTNGVAPGREEGKEGVGGRTASLDSLSLSPLCRNGTAVGNGSILEVSGDEQTEEVQRKEEEKQQQQEESREQKLWRTANELLQTEKSYVDRLHLLDQVFRLRLTEEAIRGSFPLEVVRSIFSNISSIHSFHSQFLMPDLQHRMDHWWEHPGLGDVMLQHAPFLRMYAEYVKNFDQAMELLRTWTERSAVFRNIIQDIQNQGVCGSLTLQHHMLEPVQRVPRYEMLLQEYLKKLPENDPDYNLAHKSLQTISMAAIHSNSAIHQAERLKRLLEIYEMIGEENVVNPSNEFLKEGRLLKLAARNASAMERYVFLFNNYLLCCIPKFSLVGQRFTVRTQIRVEGMQVQQTTNEDHPHTFQVSGKERTLELQASSEQERDDWIKVIREAIEEYQKKHGTFKLASKEIDAEVTTEELGRRAPRWIRDNEVTVCMKCQEAFNALTRRRHHCRACGCVVCWKCSDNKVALEYDGNKLNKVCKDCYSVLIGRDRPERSEGKNRRSLEWDCVSSDGVMSSFLQYGDSLRTWQRIWSVLPRTEPPLLCLFASPQDAKPLCRVPLLGCSVEDSPQASQELRGQAWAFRLHESSTSHAFCCDSPELKQRWLAVLHAATRNEMLAGNKNTTTGDISVTNGNGHDVANGNVVDNEIGLDGTKEDHKIEMAPCCSKTAGSQQPRGPPAVQMDNQLGL